MQLSQKHKTFAQFFPAFLKSRINLNYFEQKGDPYRFCISEITYCQCVVRSISKKSRFRGSVDKQH